MKNIILKAKDEYELSLNIYESPNPKAVIQIIHGMEEHQDRYKLFANFFKENGYIVVTSDMRGHGKNAKDLGYFKDKNGYLYLLEDQLSIFQYIKYNYNLPVHLFGHSMGTIIARVLLQKHSNKYSKIVLSGFPNYQSACELGIYLSALIRNIKGPKYRSMLLHNMSIGAFNKAIKNPRTAVDWLSFNEDNVDRYISDPLCGFGFKASAYNDLMHLLSEMHKYKKYLSINKTLPFLLVYGEKDPCVGGNKGVNDSISTLKKAGFENISLISYPHMRHEILNEIDYQKVHQDILNFLNKDNV